MHVTINLLNLNLHGETYIRDIVISPLSLFFLQLDRNASHRALLDSLH